MDPSYECIIFDGDGKSPCTSFLKPGHVGVKKMGKIKCENFYKEIYKFLGEDLKNKV